ncbi:ABC transporter ATP-binding protein [Priestia megaterium]|nr:ABC transporter ATP-binding protein [Priestia megaterium]
MIELRGVTGGYHRKKPTVKNITFQVEKGSFCALLGPNGSGKTTLVRLMMNVISIHQGEILLEGKPVDSYSAVQLAKKIAVMTQENQIGLEFTVREIVALGRYPFQSKSLLSTESKEDRAIIEQVMKLTDVWRYRNHLFNALSGGEKQRVLLAKALAQEPEYLLLDEPTNHLDVKHTMELLHLLKKLQLETNLTIVAILHDLNIASLFADDAVLLKEGEVHEIGVDNIFGENDTLKNVYDVDLYLSHHPVVDKRQLAYIPSKSEKKPLVFADLYELTELDDCVTLTFQQSFRTVSIGKQGKGIHWCRKIIQSERENQERDHQALLWSGIDHRYTYLFLQEIEHHEWLFLFTKEKNEDTVHIVTVTAASLSDETLLNTAVQIAEQRALLHIKGGHIVVSSLRKAGEYSEVQDEVKDTIQRELHKYVNSCSAFNRQ